MAEGYLGVSRFNSMNGNSPTTRYYLGVDEDLTGRFSFTAYGEMNKRNEDSDTTFKIAPSFSVTDSFKLFIVVEREVQSNSPSLFRDISYIDDRAGIGLEYKAW